MPNSNSNSIYKSKYLRYKNKYLNLKKIINLKNMKGGEIRTIKSFSIDVIPTHDKDGKPVSLMAQLKMFIRLIECFLLNQVLTLFCDTSDTKIQLLINKINETQCLVLSNPKANVQYLDDSEKDERRATINYITRGRDSMFSILPLSYQGLISLIGDDATKILYQLSKGLTPDTFFRPPKYKEILEQSIQKLLNSDAFVSAKKSESEERTHFGYNMGIDFVGRSDLSYLIPNNSIIRMLLKPLHDKGLKNIITIDPRYPSQTNNINADASPDLSPIGTPVGTPPGSPRLSGLPSFPLFLARTDGAEGIDYWDHYDSQAIINLIKDIVDEFAQKRIVSFAESIIPQLKDIYESNPSAESALLLAKLGIPDTPYLTHLVPVPDITKHQTSEEKIILQPLLEIIANFPAWLETYSQTIFYEIINSVSKLDASLSIKLPYNITARTQTGIEIKINVIESETGYDLKRKIASEINGGELRDSTGTVVPTGITPSDISIIVSKFKDPMDDSRILSDYGLREGSVVNVVLKLKSGILSEPPKAFGM